MDNLTIRLETEKDYRAVEELTREAFWNVYKPGALDGRKWIYIPSTAADCCENTDAVEAFDATFPLKEMDAESGRILYLQPFFGGKMIVLFYFNK